LSLSISVHVILVKEGSIDIHGDHFPLSLAESGWKWRPAVVVRVVPVDGVQVGSIIRTATPDEDKTGAQNTIVLKQ
jgi:hypothetical protein